MNEIKRIYNAAFAALQQNKPEVLYQIADGLWRGTQYEEFALNMAKAISHRAMTANIKHVMEAGWRFLCDLTKTSSFAGTCFLIRMHMWDMYEKFYEEENDFTILLITALWLQAEKRGREMRKQKVA